MFLRADRLEISVFILSISLLFILLMDSFSSVTRSVQQTITWMAEFMRGLAPGIFPDYIDSGREFDGSGLL